VKSDDKLSTKVPQIDNNYETNRCDIATLMGVSGCAKTSSCFLVAQERYCIYTEAPDPMNKTTYYGDGLPGLKI
jgi:hypothetical protein